MTPALRILIEVHQHQGTFTLWTRWVTVVHMLMLATSIGNIWQSSPIIGPSECWHLQMLVTCETKITWSYKWPKDRVMYICEAKFTCSCKLPKGKLMFHCFGTNLLECYPATFGTRPKQPRNWKNKFQVTSKLSSSKGEKLLLVLFTLVLSGYLMY